MMAKPIASITHELALMASRSTIVSGDYVQGSFSLLPHAGERARAALHFSRLIGSDSFKGNLELSRWYLRASLSEFQSIFDLLNTDLKAINVAHEWKNSKTKKQMEIDPIVSVLRKVRDFAIHSANIVGAAKTFTVISTDVSQSQMSSIVVEPVDRVMLSAARGKDELRGLDDEKLQIFNKHASEWPADLLIHIAIYRTSEYLATFLRQRRNES